MILEICRELTDAIRGITPRLDSNRPFRCAEDGRGGVRSPRDWMLSKRELRDFDVRALLNVRRDGCSMRGTINVRIAYPSLTDLGLSNQRMGEDLESFSSQVLWVPGLWLNADDLWQEEEPSIEEVSSKDGRPVQSILTIPLEASWPISPRPDDTHVEFTSLVSLPGQQARVGMQVWSKGRKVSSATEVTVNYYSSQGDPVSPTFWVDHAPDGNGRFRPRFLTSVRTSVMTGKSDECATIVTDASGYAELGLRFAGVEPGLQRIRATVGEAQTDGELTTVGGRRFVAPGDLNAADNPYPTNGTSSAPWATLAYAAGQMEYQDQERDVALCLRGSLALADGSEFAHCGAGIVAVEPGVVIGGWFKVGSLYSPDPSLFRGVRVESSAASRVEGAAGARVFLSGISASSNSSSVAYRFNNRNPLVRLLGCSVDGGGQYAVEPHATDGGENTLEVLHCDLLANVHSFSFRGPGQFSSISIHQTRLYGPPATIFAALSVSLSRDLLETLSTDHNDYEKPGFYFVYDDGTIYTLEEWRAATRNDANSTMTT